MTALEGPARLIGQSVPRVEDERILTGHGRYLDDIKVPNMAHAAFVRSMIPHGRITNIDVEAARSMPGVLAVLTGEELASMATPLQIPLELETYQRPVWTVFATDRVRYVGDPIAIVVAESRYEAEDARDAVVVEIEQLDAVATVEQALDPSRPVLFDDIGTNLIYDKTTEYGDVDAAFANARVVEATIRTARVTQVPMEGRGGLADFDPGTGELTYHASNQAPNGIRTALAGLISHPVERLHVRMPDMGGGFGQKVGTFREDIAVAAAARMLRCAVKWAEDRQENLGTASHSRDESVVVRAAVDEDGAIRGLDVDMTTDQGAYPHFIVPSPLFAIIAQTMVPGPYKIGSLRFRNRVVATNKASLGAYRGPWAIESLIREVMVDRIARELGLDPVDVRRRNMVSLAEQPCKMLTGPTLEGVSSLDTLERAAEVIGYDDLREEQRRAREQGRLLGIGIATYIEGAPGPPDYWSSIGLPFESPERARAQLEPNGHVTVFSTQAPHGQGHRTTLAQVAATEFGVPFDHVNVVFGDTRVVPFSPSGTGGSKAATMASGAAMHATRGLKQKVLELAGGMMEIAADDLEIVGAAVQAKGAPGHAIPLAQIAMAAYYMPPPGEEPGLPTSAVFATPAGGWSGGTHVCVSEIDAETGVVSILRYLVVEDCGTVINPGIVDGQIRGGVAQGIGIALYEDAHYDEDGNFTAGTFMDYLVPTAMEIPSIEIEHLHAQHLHEVDFRGVGEGGTIAAPAAVANSVADALGGLTDVRLPFTPERVLDLADAK